jgi:hypothetical protein
VEIIPDVVPVIESTFGVVEITNGISEVESRVGVPVIVGVGQNIIFPTMEVLTG